MGFGAIILIILYFIFVPKEERDKNKPSIRFFDMLAPRKDRYIYKNKK
jgi:hypothetical protein